MMDYTSPGRIRWSIVNDDIGPAAQHLIESLQKSGATARDVHNAMRNLSKSFELVRPRLPVFNVLSNQSPEYVIQEEP
jgi:hypothetical protein